MTLDGRVNQSSPAGPLIPSLPLLFYDNHLYKVLNTEALSGCETLLPFNPLLFSLCRRRRDGKRPPKNRKNLFLALSKADANVKMMVLEQKGKVLVIARATLGSNLRLILDWVGEHRTKMRQAGRPCGEEPL